MGGGRGGLVSDAERKEPDEDLLEFLGGVDELNEDSGEGGFQDFLANIDIDQAAERKESDAKEDKK
jgi:hypothetical protein